MFKFGRGYTFGLYDMFKMNNTVTNFRDCFLGCTSLVNWGDGTFNIIPLPPPSGKLYFMEYMIHPFGLKTKIKFGR